MMHEEAQVARDPAEEAAYFSNRAAWHEHRAQVAEDTSTRALHRKFAVIYQRRAEA